MKILRYALTTLAGLIAVIVILGAIYYYKGFAHLPFHRRTGNSSITVAERSRIRQRAASIKPFLAAEGYNSNICFLVDMQQPSGRNRFFVYDARHDSVMMTGLVAHGSAGREFSLHPRFSNLDGSNCTALGRYRIGKPYAGRFGTAYKLYGLDTSNDQAFKRNIVLHSFQNVPERETDPFPICNSQGCPMVAPGFLQKLKPIIDGSGKPIMLVIFY